MTEKIRVLIVDDSAFFRKRIRQQLEQTGEIEVVGEAGDGEEAVRMAESLQPDLITMDVAMPRMDGIAAVREIMRRKPCDILMVSALTREGARSTLEALEAGALDFFTKQPGLGDQTLPGMGGLGERVVGMARRKGLRRVQPAPRGTPVASRPASAPPSAPVRRAQHLKLVLIGASTGGPVAVQRVLSVLPKDYPYPVVVAVHMPAEFTTTFAERLDAQCRVAVRHAADGDALSPGQVYVSPGGMQTLIQVHGGRLQLRVVVADGQLYRPSVDLLFESAASALGNAVQALILTGMGADGAAGARALKQRGAALWSQDEASSVVYGMPQAVAKAGLTDRVLALDQIGTALAELA